MQTFLLQFSKYTANITKIPNSSTYFCESHYIFIIPYLYKPPSPVPVDILSTGYEPKDMLSEPPAPKNNPLKNRHKTIISPNPLPHSRKITNFAKLTHNTVTT